MKLGSDKMADNKNNINIDFSTQEVKEQDSYQLTKEIVTVKTGKRHAIKINDINAYKNIYETTNTIKTNNLIKTEARSIAIFCNEYIPPHFTKGIYIQYFLTINGTSIEIVPVNSDRNGIKIIKTSDYDLNSDYVHYTNQKIKSAYLTIIIKTPNQYESPFISNLKVLVGDKNV